MIGVGCVSAAVQRGQIGCFSKEELIAPTVQFCHRWAGVSRDAVLLNASCGEAGDLFP